MLSISSIKGDLDNPSQYFTDYVRRYTDMPMLVMLEERDGYYAAGRMLRAADLVDALGQENNPEWKTVAFNTNGEMVAPNGSIGFRWGEKPVVTAQCSASRSQQSSANVTRSFSPLSQRNSNPSEHHR